MFKTGYHRKCFATAKGDATMIVTVRKPSSLMLFALAHAQPSGAASGGPDLSLSAPDALKAQAIGRPR